MILHILQILARHLRIMDERRVAIQLIDMVMEQFEKKLSPIKRTVLRNEIARVKDGIMSADTMERLELFQMLLKVRNLLDRELR